MAQFARNRPSACSSCSLGGAENGAREPVPSRFFVRWFCLWFARARPSPGPSLRGRGVVCAGGGGGLGTANREQGAGNRERGTGSGEWVFGVIRLGDGAGLFRDGTMEWRAD